MKKFFSFFVSRMLIIFVMIAVQAFLLIMIATVFDAISDTIDIFFVVLSLIMTVYIINKRQNSSYKLAWIIPILFLPVLGILLYLFFSQRKLSKKMRLRGLEIYSKSSRLLGQDRRIVREISGDLDVKRQSDYIKNASDFPVYDKTETKYFPMGEDFYKELLVELETAEKYIFMEYFIVHEGHEMWNTIFEILKRKAKQGVEVRFMYDDIGCIHTLPNKYYKKIQEAGIKCAVFNPLRPTLSSMFNNRDHRKITSIDGRVAFCGGANLADEYINVKQRFGKWKDAVVMLKGAAAWGFTVMFLQMWDNMQTVDDDYSIFRPDEKYISQFVSDGYVQPFADAPFIPENVSENVYLNMISKAKNYLYINTPYLIIDNEIMTALTNAAKCGVDVRIVTPHIPDKKFVFLVTRAYYAQLIEAGVKIYEYTPGFIHSKTFCCDDVLGIVGTVNLDYRSLFLHFECGAWMYKTSAIMDMKKDYLETLDVCQEVTIEVVKSTKWYVRIMQSILRVFAPLM
ncbi:MAG: cardiolipin synthase [Christensenellaceae bacterium]